MISNSSAISVPSSQSAQQMSTLANNNNNNNNSNNQNHSNLNCGVGGVSGGGGGGGNVMMMNGNNSQSNGSLLVPHSQSAHQLGHGNVQPPLTPLSHHQALQQQLAKHFASNNLGESNNLNNCIFYKQVLEAYNKKKYKGFDSMAKGCFFTSYL